MQEQLLGYLLGALEDEEQERVQSRLSGDPPWREELATLRGQLKPLDSSRSCFEFDPPPGLVQRTCRLVASRAKLVSTARSRTASLSAEAAQPGATGGFRWHDLVVAAAVLAGTILLTVPALQHSRFHSRLLACQNKLFNVGSAAKRYAAQHNGVFPSVRVEDTFAVAGSYAATLLDEGFLDDARQLICPGSSLTDGGEVPVPSCDALQPGSSTDLGRLNRIYSCTVGYRRNGVYHDTRDLQRVYFALLADPPNAGSPVYRSDNHGGKGQNVLMEDGHVEFLTSPRFIIRGDHIYSNDQGAQAPGTHENDSVILPPGTPVIWTSN